MDYKNFKVSDAAKSGEARAPGATDRNSGRWWMQKSKEEAAKAAWTQQRALEDAQAYRQEELVRYARLYGNKDLASLRPSQYAKPRSEDGHKRTASTNVVRQGTDTVVALTTASRPRPAYLTEGGDYGQREKAKKLNKFTRGQFYEAKYYEQSPQSAVDACVWGTGVLKVLEKDGRATIERTFVGQLFVDDMESVWGQPRQMYQRMTIARDVLRAMFPEKENYTAIEDAQPEENTSGETLAGDMVTVVEAWHLPSGAEAKDGKHLICTSAGILGEVDDWTKDYFPFAFLRWANPLVGFWGTGIAEQLLGKQYELNKLILRIQEMMHFSVPRIFLPNQSKVPKGMITNKIAQVIPFEGMTPPVVMAATFVPPEYWKRSAELKQEALEEIGVSQQAATGTKPAGLNSGAAQREFSDITSARFVRFGQAYEQFALDTARLLIDLTRDLVAAQKIAENEDKEAAATKRAYKVTMPSKKFIESIDWMEIDLDEDKYVMQAFPVSSLPTTPAARQETVAEWIAQGWVTPEEGRRLLDFPDLEESTNLAVAALDDIDQTLDAILAGRDYGQPEPFQPLDLAIKRAMAAYLVAKREKYPEGRLDNLRTWIMQAKALKDQAAPPELAPPPSAMPPVAADPTAAPPVPMAA